MLGRQCKAQIIAKKKNYEAAGDGRFLAVLRAHKDHAEQRSPEATSALAMEREMKLVNAKREKKMKDITAQS
jgi:hypothetical protein